MRRSGHATKKARVDFDVEHEEPLDPIAAAIEAKRVRLLEATSKGGDSQSPDILASRHPRLDSAPDMHSTSTAAPASLFPVVTTTITRRPGQRPGEVAASNTSIAVPQALCSVAAVAGGGSTAAKPADSSDGGGALAALLGYSDVEEGPSSAEDHAGDQAVAAVLSAPLIQKLVTNTMGAEDARPQGSSGGGAPSALEGPDDFAVAHQLDGDAAVVNAETGATGGGDPMDLELASFMQELEASGLLCEGGAEAAAMDSEGGGAVPVGTAATADAGPSDPGAVSVGDMTADGGDDGDVAAEQQVLGYLMQAPEWSKCLDTGSGKVYYWNLDTGEVVWEPPPGADADLLLPPAEGAASGEAGDSDGGGADAALAHTGGASALSVSKSGSPVRREVEQGSTQPEVLEASGHGDPGDEKPVDTETEILQQAGNREGTPESGQPAERQQSSESDLQSDGDTEREGSAVRAELVEKRGIAAGLPDSLVPAVIVEGGDVAEAGDIGEAAGTPVPSTCTAAAAIAPLPALGDDLGDAAAAAPAINAEAATNVGEQMEEALVTDGEEAVSASPAPAAATDEAAVAQEGAVSVSTSVVVVEGVSEREVIHQVEAEPVEMSAGITTSAQAAAIEVMGLGEEGGSGAQVVLGGLGQSAVAASTGLLGSADAAAAATRVATAQAVPAPVVANADVELLQAVTAMLLRPPQPHIHQVMAALEAEAAEAARCFLQDLPLLVRLAVEAQVRAADWRQLAAQQAAAAAVGQPADAVCWPSLERHIVSRVKHLLETLPAASAEAQQMRHVAYTAMSVNVSAAKHSAEGGLIPALPNLAGKAAGLVDSTPQGAAVGGATVFASRATTGHAVTGMSEGASEGHPIDRAVYQGEDDMEEGELLETATHGSPRPAAAAQEGAAAAEPDAATTVASEATISDPAALAPSCSNVMANGFDSRCFYSWPAHLYRYDAASYGVAAYPYSILYDSVGIGVSCPDHIPAPGAAPEVDGPQGAIGHLPPLPPLPPPEEATGAAGAPLPPSSPPLPPLPPEPECAQVDATPQPPLPPNHPPSPGPAPTDDDCEDMVLEDREPAAPQLHDDVPQLPPGFESAASYISAYGQTAYDVYMSQLYGYAYGMAPPPTTTSAGHEALQFVNSYLGYGPAVAADAGAIPDPPPLPPSADLDTESAGVEPAAKPPLPPQPKRKEYRAHATRNPTVAAGPVVISEELRRAGREALEDFGKDDTRLDRVSASPTPPPVDLLNMYALPSAPVASTADVGAAANAHAAAVKRKAAAMAVGGGGVAAAGAKRSKGLDKRMGALVQKWSAAAKQLEQEEEERARKAAEAEDPHAQERKRLAELERWKRGQEVAGAAKENANFAPLGDWRSRFPKLAGNKGGASTDSNAAGAAAGSEDAAASAAVVAAKKSRKAAKEEGKKGAKEEGKKGKREKKEKKEKAAASEGLLSGVHHHQQPQQPQQPQPSAVTCVLNFKTKPDLEALSAGLPSGWKAMWDKGSGDVYYGNLTTRETRWTRPT